MTNKLIKIADVLDAAGFKKEADFVDKLTEETTRHNKVIYNFVENLVAAFKNIARQQNISSAINGKSLPAILQVINNTLEKKEYDDHVLNMETLKQLEDPIRRIGDGVLALEDDMPKILKDVSDSKNEMEKRNFEHEYQDAQKKLKNLYDRVQELKDGRRAQDIQQYEELKNYLKSRGKEI